MTKKIFEVFLKILCHFALYTLVFWGNSFSKSIKIRRKSEFVTHLKWFHHTLQYILFGTSVFWNENEIWVIQSKQRENHHRWDIRQFSEFYQKYLFSRNWMNLMWWLCLYTVYTANRMLYTHSPEVIVVIIVRSRKHHVLLLFSIWFWKVKRVSWHPNDVEFYILHNNLWLHISPTDIPQIYGKRFHFIFTFFIRSNCWKKKWIKRSNCRRFIGLTKHFAQTPNNQR